MLYTRNRNRYLEEMPSIKPEGVLLTWIQKVKYIETYITPNW